ncbi:uncharacterized protein LOC143246333 isoform X2 [Tachypleus tridentatus]|uniref:uncharacterized protein LOC143246333 isoform X2 n=1 Tax=Tachypleus tridentatus TaxID=6853 RepID=UPI003FD05F42
MDDKKQVSVSLALPENQVIQPQSMEETSESSTFSGQEQWIQGQPHGISPRYPMNSRSSEYSYIDPARSSSYSPRMGLLPSSSVSTFSFNQPHSQMDTHGQDLFSKYVTSASNYSVPHFQTSESLASNIAYHSPGPPYSNTFHEIHTETLRQTLTSENPVPLTGQGLSTGELKSRHFDNISHAISTTNKVSSPGISVSDGSEKLSCKTWRKESGQEQEKNINLQKPQTELPRSHDSSLTQEEMLPVSRKSNDSTLQEHSEKGNENLLTGSRDQSGPPSRPSSHFSTSPGLENRRMQELWSQNEKIQDTVEKGKSYYPHHRSQNMGFSESHFSSSNSPTPNMALPPFGNPNSLQYKLPQNVMSHIGHQQHMFHPVASSGFPSPKHMKIDQDAPVSDARANVENSFQVPSVSSTTPRQILPSMVAPVEQWEAINVANIPPPALPLIPEAAEKPKKKRKRCGECPGCLKKDNCGECGPCKSVRSHQICKMRKCDQLKTKKERMQPYLAQNYNLGGGKKQSPLQGEKQMFEINSQYGNFHQNPPPSLAYNGHLPPTEIGEGNPMSVNLINEGASESGRRQFLHNQLKSLMHNHQNQEEEAFSRPGRTESYQVGTTGNPSDQLYVDNQSLSPSVVHSQNIPGGRIGHSSYTTPPGTMSGPLPPISEAMRAYAHPRGGMSPHWQSRITSRVDGTGQFSAHETSFKNSFLKDIKEENPECTTKEETHQSGYPGTTSDKHSPLNGTRYSAFYSQEVTQQEGKSSKVHHQHSVDNVEFIQGQPSFTNYPIQSTESHTHQYTQLPSIVSPFKRQNINSALVFSHPASPSQTSPSMAELTPVSESSNDNHQEGTLPPDSGNVVTSLNETGENTVNEESEPQPFLLNTTTSMNTYTNIINTYNFTSPASFCSSLYSFFSPAFGVTTTPSSVITEVNPFSASINSKLQESSSIKGGLVMSDIDSGRIDDSYGQNLYGSNHAGLPTLFAFPTGYSIASRHIVVDPSPAT